MTLWCLLYVWLDYNLHEHQCETLVWSVKTDSSGQQWKAFHVDY